MITDLFNENYFLASPDQQLAFCCIPKAASTSFRYFFMDHGWTNSHPHSVQNVFYIKRDEEERRMSGISEVYKRACAHYPDYPSVDEIYEKYDEGKLFVDIHLVPIHLLIKDDYISVNLNDIHHFLSSQNLDWNKFEHLNKTRLHAPESFVNMYKNLLSYSFKEEVCGEINKYIFINI